MTAVAHGQGARPFVPDPIATADLVRYADKLQLSQAQLQAALALHDQYKADFKALSDTEVLPLVARIYALFMSGTANTPKRMHDVGNDIRALTAKVNALDEHYFNQLGEVLTPQQAAALPRVRWARQRECIRMASNNYHAVLNVSELVRELEVPIESRPPIDAILTEYEQKLTAIAIKLWQLNLRTSWDLMRTLKAKGLGDKDLDQPLESPAIEQARGAVSTESQTEIRSLIKQATDLNDKTVNSLADALPPALAHTLRLVYYCERYYGDFNDYDEVFAEALKLDGLSQEQRDALTAARGELHRAVADILQRALAAEHKFERENDADALRADQEALRAALAERHKMVEGFQLEITSAETRASEAVKSILGEDEATRLSKFVVTISPDRFNPHRRPRQTPPVAPQPEDDDPAFEPIKQFSYLRMSELASVVEQLNLNDAQKAQLAKMHRDYRERLLSIAQNEMKAIDEAHRATYVQDESGGIRSIATAELIDKLQQCQRAVVDAVRGADQALLDGLAAFDAANEHTEKIDRLRQAGYRRILAKFSAAEASPNEMHWFLSRLPLDENDRNIIDPILAGFESESIVLLEAIFHAELRWRKAQSLLDVANANRENADGKPRKTDRYVAMVEAATKKKAEAVRVLADLHKKTIESMVEALPLNAALTMKNEYNLRMHHEAYYDPASVDRHIHMSLFQLALSPSQRQSLEDLAAEYRPAYAQICEQLVEFENHDGMRTLMPSQRIQQAMLQFERAEMNHRGAIKLGWILTPAQLQSIGGLPTLERKP